MKFTYLILTSFLVILACSDQKTIESFPDPYLNSFRGKGIKTILMTDLNDSLGWTTDTISLDTKGNVLRIKRFSYEQFREYDKLNYLISMRTVTDIYENYVIKYYYSQDDLIQEWSSLGNSDLVSADSSSKVVFNRVRFKLKSERIVGLVDSLNNQNTEYSYDEYNVVRITSKTIDRNEFLSESLFEYEDNRKLKTMSLLATGLYRTENGDFRPSETIYKETCFFTDGLPDSLVRENLGNSIVIRYRYLYY